MTLSGKRGATGRLMKAKSTRKARSSAPAATAPTKGRIRAKHETTILRAAERVFARAGFRGATMEAIAQEAGLPKANLHYYFHTKEDIYRAVLDETLADWLAETDCIVAAADPRAALAQYIRAKMRLAAERPDASRVFANEMLHGAPVLGETLRTGLRELVRDKAAVIDGWIAAGRMAPIDSTHLFFTIWAATQTYSDFNVQVRAVLGRRRLDAADFERATEHLVALILRGCGLRG
jgi:TetR/AcrR family transcriptional regulator